MFVLPAPATQIARHLLVVAFFFCCLSGIATCDEIRCALKPAPPFVVRESDGNASGFSVDLLELLCKRLEATPSFIWATTVDTQLSLVASGEADLAISAITITADREESVDFTHAFYKSGLRIATVRNGNLTLIAAAKNLVGLDLVGLLMLLLGLCLVSANVLWAFERKANSEEFPRAYFRGLIEALWWSLCTLISGGCENKAARTIPGRLVSLTWMLGGIVLVALFTATLASRMTVANVMSSISGPEDLPGHVIATVRDTEAHDTLVTMRAKTAAFDTLADAVDALAAHQAEAVVFDAPLLAHEISLRESSDVVLTGPLFDLQDYGIAVAEGSDLREKLNRELLHAVEDGQVRRLQEQWFGEYQ